MDKTKKKYIVLAIVTVVISIVALIGASYALLTITLEGDKKITLTAGILTVDFTDGNYINLDNIAPMSDSGGLKTTPYTFTITNTGNINAYYHVSLEEESTNTLPNSYLKMRLTNDQGYDSGVVKVNSYGTSTFDIKGEEILEPSDKVTYQLWMWLDENADNSAQGKEYKSKIAVTSYDRKGNTPNTPELDSNMIAVTYDGTNWVKADTSNNYWYNYDNGEWANAVTVSESSRSNYLSAEVGTVISMDDIETMWVWIPRYSYSIGSVDGTNYYGKKGCYLESNPTLSLPGEIDIRFVSTNIKDRGTAKYVTTRGAESWYTPDAFTFGDTELSGVWVGKFETTSSNPSTTDGGENTAELDPMIKPNVTSWRMINVSNAFNVSLKMNDAGNRYSFNESTDTHMMKNSEWAIVAYLSQSKYGKLGNINFTGLNKEVYLNKSNQFITGCSYGGANNSNTDSGCHYTYDENISGTGASTTGTIYGVYDMSGGAWEYVMGNYNDMTGDSGFGEPLTLDSKYYDKYTSNNINIACNGNNCLGHGLSEIAGWYNDFNNMISEEYPWMLRGGGYTNNSGAGIFHFGAAYVIGSAGIDTYTFRLVATIR